MKACPDAINAVVLGIYIFGRIIHPSGFIPDIVYRYSRCLESYWPKDAAVSGEDASYSLS